MRILGSLLALMASCCAAQDTGAVLVNLGRLSIARVFATGGRESFEADKFYGARNAFDGGSNVLNGINYSSWHGDPGAFLIVRFSQPVTVRGIVVEAGDSSSLPEYFE